MPAGRPTKYEERFCEEVVEFLRDGYSIAAFAGHIGVAVSTVRLWMSEHTEFSCAVKEGQAAAILWWEQRAREVAQGRDGNPTTIIFGLKNRAPDEWRDKTETEHSGAVTVSTITRTIVDPNA